MCSAWAQNELHPPGSRSMGLWQQKDQWLLPSIHSELQAYHSFKVCFSRNTSITFQTLAFFFLFHIRVQNDLLSLNENKNTDNNLFYHWVKLMSWLIKTPTNCTWIYRISQKNPGTSNICNSGTKNRYDDVGTCNVIINSDSFSDTSCASSPTVV